MISRHENDVIIQKSIYTCDDISVLLDAKDKIPQQTTFQHLVIAHWLLSILFPDPEILNDSGNHGDLDLLDLDWIQKRFQGQEESVFCELERMPKSRKAKFR